MAIVYGRRRPYLIVGWFWYLGTALPTIGLVQVGIQAMADRYTYIPSIGIAWLAVWGVCDVAARRGKLGVWALCAIGATQIAAYLVLTTVQTHWWKDSLSLFNQAVRDVPDNYFGYNHLGKEYDRLSLEKMREMQEALVRGETEKAAKLNAEMEHYRDEAIANFKETLKINPSYDFGHNNLGVCYARRGQDDLAIQQFEEALSVNQSYADAYSNLCRELITHKRFEEAVAYGERGMKVRDDRAGDHVNLALAYEGVNRLPEVQAHYERAIELNPLDAENKMAYVLLAELRLKLNDPSAAGEVLKKYGRFIRTRCKRGSSCAFSRQDRRVDGGREEREEGP